MAKKAVVAIAVLAFIAVLAVAAASNLLNIGPFQEIPNAVPHEGKYDRHMMDADSSLVC